MSNSRDHLGGYCFDPETEATYRLHIRVREFNIPPIRDALVLGRRAAIGCYAIRKALHLLMAAPFVHIELDDEVISDVIVREAVLRRFPREHLIAFVLERIRPLMGEEEILQMELETEMTLAMQVSGDHHDSPDRS